MSQIKNKKTKSNAKVSNNKKKDTKPETKKKTKDDPKKISDFDYSFCREASDFFWVEYAKRNAASKRQKPYNLLKELYEEILKKISKLTCNEFNPLCIENIFDFFENYKIEENNNKNIILRCLHEHSKNRKCIDCSPSLINQIIKLINGFNSDFGNYHVSILDFFNYSELETTLESFLALSLDKLSNKNKYKHKHDSTIEDGNEIILMDVFPNSAPIIPPKPQLVTKVTSENSHYYGDLILKVHSSTPNFSLEEAINQFTLCVWAHLSPYEKDLERKVEMIKNMTKQDFENKIKQDIVNIVFINEFLKQKREHHIKGFLCNSIFQRFVGLLIWDIVFFSKKPPDEGIEIVEKKVKELTRATNFKTFKYSGYKDAYLKANKYIQDFDPESLKDL